MAFLPFLSMGYFVRGAIVSAAFLTLMGPPPPQDTAAVAARTASMVMPPTRLDLFIDPSSLTVTHN
jgi:hypothetical protein